MIRENKFLLETIPLCFERERLVAETEQILAKYPLQSTPRRDGSTLRSLSLTHRPEAKEPLYDGNNTQYASEGTKFFSEKDFSEFNPEFKDTVFREIYEQMPYRVGRMRLNLMPPLTVFTMHKDSAPRAQVAIRTNPDCFIVGKQNHESEIYHIPEDNNAYVMDTRLEHTAFNASRFNRYHLIMSLVDFEV